MMKIVLPILVFGLLAGSSKAADSDDQLPAPSEGKAWKLVWHDEFFLLMAWSVQAGEPKPVYEFRSVRCEGSYPHHLQGVCTDEREAVFWSLTTQLVKTDLTGKVLKQVPVANHHGDLCYQDGKAYVAVNLGKFNDPQGNADSWVYVSRPACSATRRHCKLGRSAGTLNQRKARIVGGRQSGRFICSVGVGRHESQPHSVAANPRPVPPAGRCHPCG